MEPRQQTVAFVRPATSALSRLKIRSSVLLVTTVQFRLSFLILVLEVLLVTVKDLEPCLIALTVGEADIAPNLVLPRMTVTVMQGIIVTQMHSQLLLETQTQRVMFVLQVAIVRSKQKCLSTVNQDSSIQKLERGLKVIVFPAHLESTVKARI